MDSWLTGTLLFLVAAAFAAAGVIYSRSRGAAGALEDYITARGTVGTPTAAATLIASGMGAWILFGPAEAATWDGLPTLLGYSLGAAAPLLVFIPLGARVRRLMPEGHSLTEYVYYRYGRGMYLFTLAVIVFYMFVFLAAEVTGMCLIANLIADVPMWVTAVVVVGATLAYTAYGGLKASIFTDAVQTLFILPLLAAVVVGGYVSIGGFRPAAEGLAERAPQLAEWGSLVGIGGGLTFVIAVLVANLFHQGYWQRVYAVRDTGVLRRGCLIAAVAVVPIVFFPGLFGLAAVGLNRVETPSVALFGVLLGSLPAWLVLGLAILALALVMSSADTLLNGISSIVAVDLRRSLPGKGEGFLLNASRLSTLVLAIPLVLIASQGYSVLYLLLLADLVCASAAFPVFFGLYSERHTGRVAVAGTLAGLIAGAFFFPNPAMTRGTLLGAFLVALGISMLVSLALAALISRREAFDLGSLAGSVRRIEDGG
jgi:Na+/proline symporter